MKIKVFLLKKWFSICLHFNYFSSFRYNYGANGIILIPKNKLFDNLCIKCAMDSNFKKMILKNEKDSDRRLFLEMIIKEKGSVNDDIKTYFDIVNTPFLKKFVPVIFYANITKGFFIMEYLKGEKEMIEGVLPSCTDLDFNEINSLEDLYCYFKHSNFEFNDKVEAIRLPDHSIRLIDLGDIRKTV